MDNSLFQGVDRIETNFSKNLRRVSGIQNDWHGLYVPINKDEKHMLEMLSTNPAQELSRKEVKRLLDEERALESSVANLVQDIKMDCHYHFYPVQIIVSSCKRNQNHLCIGGG